MKKCIHIFIIVCFAFIKLEVFSQDLNNLKQQKKEVENKITLTNQLISQTQKNKKTTVNDIKLIQKQIEYRNKLIKINISVTEKLSDSIVVLNGVIGELTIEIETLIKEYEKLIQSAYIRKIQYNDLNFFLSSSSFNQAYRKFVLLNEYNKYRRKQGEILMNSKNSLNLKKLYLSELKIKNQTYVDELLVERENLEKEISKKNVYLKSFKRKESKLRRDVKRYTNSLGSLNTKINDIIASFSKDSYVASDFGKMVGKLKLPVNKGVIISKFGIHYHPVLKNVKIKNNGIDIKVLSGSDVSCVFNGVVTKVVVIPGYNSAVIVRHGKYLTVYANLKVVVVKQGQKIERGEKIGTVFSGEGENSNVVHFEIWEERTKQNPEKWLIL